MQKDYITEITEIISTLKEHELVYLLAFVEKMFGSR